MENPHEAVTGRAADLAGQVIAGLIERYANLEVAFKSLSEKYEEQREELEETMTALKKAQEGSGSEEAEVVDIGVEPEEGEENDGTND